MTQTYYSEYNQFFVSVDCIIFGFENGKLHILLGKRKLTPGEGLWSLYGGFVNPTESLQAAAARVLYDLTGLNGIYMRQVGAYGEPKRDPGSRVISVAYCALINVADYDEKLRKQYGLRWIEIDQLPTLYSDHETIVKDAHKMLQKHLFNEPLCFSLLPEMFTLTQLQKVVESILGKELDKRNFRKRIKQCPAIVGTGIIDKSSSRRGALLYSYDSSCTDFHL